MKNHRKPRKAQSNRRPSWSAVFKRVQPSLWEEVPTFKLRGSYGALYSYGSYQGGHEALDRLILACKEQGYPKKASASDSCFNVFSSEVFYDFEDGGLLIYAGNYISEETPVGAYLLGFEALRWAIQVLDLEPPRKLRGEVVPEEEDDEPSL